MELVILRVGYNLEIAPVQIELSMTCRHISKSFNQHSFMFLAIFLNILNFRHDSYPAMVVV